MPDRHGGGGPVARLVFPALRELAPGLAPAREVALHDLAIGAGARELATRGVDCLEPAGVTGFGALMLGKRGLEIAALAAGVDLGA